MGNDVKSKYSLEDQAIMSLHGIRQIQYYQDKIDRARAAGYNSYLTYMIDLYDKLKSSYKVGVVLGICQRSVIMNLNKMGVKIMPRGGSHHPPAKLYDGRPCLHCGDTLRYISNSCCVKCSRRRFEEWSRKKRSRPQNSQPGVG
jgi:hypothetical protein